MNHCVFSLIIAVCVCNIAPAVNAPNAWTVDSQSDWIDGTASQSHLKFQDGMAIPTGKTATLQSKIKS